ncbi:MAG: DUF6498-containing protein [Henriciella sp.]|uniref:DUF6498-containing protein n=1 Tax=Henriciella sp. TaxID=1968823 RepID=UPI003C77DCD9
MLNWLKPDALAEAYRDPVSWAILAVDLFPLYAILQFGWDATSLVFLYWLENLVIGAVTLLRMAAASIKNGLAGGVAMLFSGPFFTFHYGMFCFVHGVFLMVFAEISRGREPPFPTPVGLVEFALGSGAHMMVFVGAIFALQLFLFFRDFIGRGQWRETEMAAEMMKPYGRIILLHVGIFVGFGLMMALNAPMLGILALILMRTLWGIYQTVRRRLNLDETTAIKVDEPSRI